MSFGESIDDKKGAEDLATIIKSTHSHLRKRVLAGDEADSVWKEHANDSKRLKTYAKAMETLATQHWTKHKETRVEWVYKYVMNYFKPSGMLSKILDKSQRSINFHTQNRTIPNNEQMTPNIEKRTTPDINCCGVLYDNMEEYKNHCERIQSELELILEHNICLPAYSESSSSTRRLNVLDVGSCYAPFTKYEEFDVLSVDLCPANKDVYVCDFLSVTFSTSKDWDYCEERQISTLNSMYYDVVVFSLLLEYMPAAMQRYKCCVNAHQAMRINGILIIITPDSNKQHRRVQQMKDWKKSVESIGFIRCHYQKMEHLHCVVFRKTTRSTNNNIQEKTITDLLYIPQDFNTKID